MRTFAPAVSAAAKTRPATPPAPLGDRPVGVFDSGLGGLSVLRHLPAALPGVPLVYLADTARAPYGGRPAAEIVAFGEQIADLLLGEYGCGALVVACNTATAAAVQVLRRRHPEVPIVGMEPAVKPAALATHTGVVGVMATAGTIGSEKYAALLSRYGRDVRVVADPCTGLVELIEAGQLAGPALEARLRQITAPMRAAGADAIVLGCTHFPLVAEAIARVVGPDVALIDPAPAVVRQVVRRVGAPQPPTGLAAPSPPVTFLTSGDEAAFRQNLRTLVPSMLAGALIKTVDWPQPPPRAEGPRST